MLPRRYYVFRRRGIMNFQPINSPFTPSGNEAELDIRIETLGGNSIRHFVLPPISQ